MNFYANIVKPFFDRLFAFLFLFLFSPIIVAVYLFLKYHNGGQAFFVQYRPGYKGRPFKIFKFKTMRDMVDAAGQPLPDEIRLTRAGKLIRSLSLDELLQLVNVLFGDMSLVGPRPLLMQYLPLYNEQQARRHDVMPGITGWAQINGRNTISWEQKFDYDVKYVHRQNFILDLHILALTALNVITRKGICAENHATMGAFKGSGDLISIKVKSSQSGNGQSVYTPAGATQSGSALPGSAILG